MELKFYKCAHCGQIIVKVYPTKVPVMCCGEAMQEIIPGTTDAAVEKHVPVYEVKDNKVYVTVGSVAHPMAEDHYITFIALQTKKGYQIANLKPGEEPKAVFALADGDAVEAVYEYCNLHGLWKA